MPATHLWYDTKNHRKIVGFRCELMACENRDPSYTYFMACGFSRGYLGMQVNSETERRILFSIWDDGKGGKVEVLDKASDVVVQPFGGEGEGMQCIFKHMWETGQPQQFQVDAQPEGTTTIYTGYYWLDNAWKLLARFRAPNDGGYLSGLYSFLENFGYTCENERRCVYRNQSIRLDNGATSSSSSQQQWQDLSHCSCTITAEDGPYEFGLQDGGFFMRIDGQVCDYSDKGKCSVKRLTRRTHATTGCI